MFSFEAALLDQLKLLRDEYGLDGIKAEFEAEGSSFRDLVRLRRITLKADIPLYLKIGGPEAVRDIHDALEIGVDGIIAPMVETSFGLQKFVQAYKRVYGNDRIHLSFNLETRNAAEEVESLLDYAAEHVDNVTIGRSDFTASYEDSSLRPDSKFILDTIEGLAAQIVKKGLTVTMGGSLSQITMDLLKKRPELCGMLSRLETRKIILPTDSFVHKPDAIKNSLKFEELYILAKREMHNVLMNAEISRLTQLQRRL